MPEKNGGQGRNRTTDTRIFSEQISLSSMTQGNPRPQTVADSEHGKSPWITVGNPGLGIKVGTWISTVDVQRVIFDGTLPCTDGGFVVGLQVRHIDRVQRKVMITFDNDRVVKKSTLSLPKTPHPLGLAAPCWQPATHHDQAELSLWCG